MPLSKKCSQGAPRWVPEERPQACQWEGPAAHPCKRILSTTMHSSSGISHLVVRCFQVPGVRQLCWGAQECSLISWFKNHTCEILARWEILQLESPEATVHYQVISPGHSEVNSLSTVTV